MPDTKNHMTREQIEELIGRLDAHVMECQAGIDHDEYHGEIASLNRYHEDGKRSATAAAALRQLLNPWKRIESAPKDGKEILATYAGIHRIVFWDEARGGIWSIWPGRQPASPTHWMPLPHPPASPEAEE